ncbi:MAG: 2-hydroxyacyl-CoA dehydratase subunit D [Smithellaceae bacterium]
MNKIMEKFNAIAAQPFETVQELKKAKGKKLIGIAPMHFPEELVHAAGILPFVLQESAEIITDGFSYMYPNHCGITRNVIDKFVKGQLDFLDGLIYVDMCIQPRNAHIILHRNYPGKYIKLCQVTGEFTKSWVLEDAVSEFGIIKSELEKIAGKSIDDESLKTSITIYNKTRSLLRKLYDLRRANPGILRARDLRSVVMASMLMLKEEYNELLEEFINSIEKEKTPVKKGVKLFLTGHFCQAPKVDILDIIENAGGVVVDDDLFTGSRYFAIDVPMNGGSPMEALGKRYTDLSLPCPTHYHPTNLWEKYVKEKAIANKVQGVIILQPKFCEPQMAFYPYLKETLETAGIPHLLLETEHEVTSLEGAKTRIQAFMEMLK